MTHPLPIRPLMQRNPAWRLYGDNPITIDATLTWRGQPGRCVALRGILNGRSVARSQPAGTTVRFGRIAPPNRA